MAQDVLASDQGRPGWHAEGRVGAAAIEQHAFCRQAIEVWRLCRVTNAAHRVAAMLVGKDEDDVGSICHVVPAPLRASEKNISLRETLVTGLPWMRRGLWFFPQHQADSPQWTKRSVCIEVGGTRIHSGILMLIDLAQSDYGSRYTMIERPRISPFCSALTPSLISSRL